MGQTHSENSAKFVHLAIDFLPIYMNGLSEKSAQDLWDGVRAFATNIAPEVPTIWVTFEQDFKVYSRELTMRPDQLAEILKKHDLAACRPQPGEEIVVKPKMNLFRGSQMAAHLRENYPEAETLIFTGGFVDMCVALSVHGGMQYGYDCFAVSDLMFGHELERGSAALNQKFLQDAVTRQIESRNPVPEDAATRMGRLFFHDRQSAAEWVKQEPEMKERSDIVRRDLAAQLGF